MPEEKSRRDIMGKIKMDWAHLGKTKNGEVNDTELLLLSCHRGVLNHKTSHEHAPNHRLNFLFMSGHGITMIYDAPLGSQQVLRQEA